MVLETEGYCRQTRYDFVPLSPMTGCSDVDKTSHHDVAPAPDGERLCGTDLPQDESRIRCLLEGSRTARPSVDALSINRANIGALPVTVARECEVEIAYLPVLRAGALLPSTVLSSPPRIGGYRVVVSAVTVSATVSRAGVGDVAGFVSARCGTWLRSPI